MGRLGLLEFRSGYYVYAGSAFGPGGLRARLTRHWIGSTRRHWHVDHLRAAAEPAGAWFQVQQQSREHEWAGALARGRGAVPVPGFGSSDCACTSHLFHFDSAPSFEAFSRRLGRRAEGDDRLQRLGDELL